MKRILIADTNKASLVMTSEVFKDHFSGVQVLVAKTVAETIQLAETEKIDAFVIDFDLPDQNGAKAASWLKKHMSHIPVLMTAFNTPRVRDIIEAELAAYDDCLSWIKKPIRPEILAQVAKRFCEGRVRTKRRIDCNIAAQVKLSVRNKTKKIDLDMNGLILDVVS